MEGVIGFAGTKDKPIPMRPREVESMLGQIKEREDSVRPAILFEVGDTVKVADGPSKARTAPSRNRPRDRQAPRLRFHLRARNPVELETWQVEKG